MHLHLLLCRYRYLQLILYRNDKELVASVVGIEVNHVTARCRWVQRFTPGLASFL